MNNQEAAPASCGEGHLSHSESCPFHGEGHSSRSVRHPLDTGVSSLQIKPSQRLEGVQEYYFSQKLKQVAEMNARGLDVINLGVGSPDQPPSQAAIETLCTESQKPTMHGYQPYVGIVELRNAFAEWYARWYGVSLNPQNEIQPLIGSKEGILHVTLAFVNAGDEVWVPNPGYPTYSSLSQLLDATVHPYDLTEETGWYPNFEQWERDIHSGVKLIWTNYPQMPTGAPATMQLYERLVAFAKRHGVVIVNDNPYSFILNDNPLSILAVEGAKECCIELNSMSKAHNMPGWRVGMLATNAEFVRWILKVKSNIDSGTFRPMQLAAAKALEAQADWYATNNRRYARRRELAQAVMEALGCTYDAQQTGLFLWGRIPDRYATVEDLTEPILTNAKVFITPGHIFGHNGERYIRLSLCQTEERFQEALSRIAKHH